MASQGWEYGGLVVGPDPTAPLVGKDSAGDVQVRIYPNGDIDVNTDGMGTFVTITWPEIEALVNP